jgi:hypothetical protein
MRARGNRNRGAGRAAGRGAGGREAPARSRSSVTTSRQSVTLDGVVIDKIDYNPEKREVQRFVETKRKISVYLGSKYQYIGNLIEFNEDHEFVDPPQPAAEALAPEADPFGFVKDEYKASVKEIRKQRVKYELDKQQSYSIVWGLCTVCWRKWLNTKRYSFNAI